MVNLNDKDLPKDIQEWKTNATARQKHYCDCLGDREYDHFSSDQLNLLDVKIAYANFGEAQNTESGDNLETVSVEHYTKEQKEYVRQIREKIVEVAETSDLNVAFLFIIVKQYENACQLPLVRFKKKDGKVCFLDNVVRVYNGWADYKENNELPKCIVCYPAGGYYSSDSNGNVEVETDTSRRCRLGEKVVGAADTTSMVLGVTSLVASIASFTPLAPIAAPVALWTGVSAGGYGVARGSYQIADRVKHEQSVNPFTDKAARNIWFGVVGGALGLGSMGVTSYITKLAARGDIARKFIRVTHTVLGASSLSVNGLGVVSNAIELISKKQEGEEVTKMELVNFGISVFFFTNAAMNMKTAKSLIRDVQINVIDAHGKTLPPETEQTFKSFRDKAVLNTKVRPNARFIKSIRQIENPAEFWKCLANQGDNHNIRFHRREFGQVVINNELVVHGNKLVEMKMKDPSTVDRIFSTTNRLMNDPQYSKDQFLSDVRTIVKEERINFETQRKQTLDKLRRTLGVKDLKDYKVGGKSVFDKMDPHSIDRLGTVMEQTNAVGDADLAKAVKTFAERVDCKNASDYIACMEIVDKCKTTEAREPTRAKVPRRDRSGQIVSELNTADSPLMDKFCQQYFDNQNAVAPHNASAEQPFKSDKLATYHFMKHRRARGVDLTPEEYFQEVKSLFDGKCNTPDWKPKYTQDGRNLTFTVQTNDGMFGVFIKPVVQTGDQAFFTATVFDSGRRSG